MSLFPPLPSDVDFPDLDDETKAEIDRLHAEMQAESQRMRNDPRLPVRQPSTAKDVWQKTHPGTEPPPTGHNAEALRELTPHQRAIYRYIFTRND